MADEIGLNIGQQGIYRLLGGLEPASVETRRLHTKEVSISGQTYNALVVYDGSGGGSGGGDGAILDGVDSGIKATVFDYTNANPLAVRLSDTNGDYVAAGAGTQYTEDDASAANPIGGQMVARRRDTPAAETDADGDVTALNCTSKGEIYVKHLDTVTVDGTVFIDDNGGSITVDGTVTANQGTDPWVVGDGGGSLTVDGTVAVSNPDEQYADNYLIVGTEKGNLILGTDGTNYQIVSVNASGHVAVQDGGGSLTVDGTVAVTQDTSPWVVGDGGGSITVDGTVAVTQDTSPWVIGDGGGSITVDGTVTANQGTDPWVIGDGGGSITIDGTVALSNPSEQYADGAADNGTEKGNIVLGSDGSNFYYLTCNSSGQLSTEVEGDIAHDAEDSGNPVKIGGKADETLPANVATGDRVDGWFDRRGRLNVTFYYTGDPVVYNVISTGSGAEIVALTSGTVHVVLSVAVTNANSGTGTQFTLTSNSVTKFGMWVAPLYGFTHTFHRGLPMTLSQNLAWACAPSVSTVYINVEYVSIAT